VCGVLASVCLLFNNFRCGCDICKDMWTGHQGMWTGSQLTQTGGVSLDLGHMSEGCIPSHLTHLGRWWQKCLVWLYSWHLVHCITDLQGFGGSTFIMA
jgi:hypothetical protein